ncbi:hypothetical protein AB0L59_23010 [Streptomyces sp. NPDC052109]|uniref:hypothetical protein n=1 Tax=Streptomyces sp. NPDC052109 TaxID=3155527 RepID=UPI00342C1CB7
MRSALRPAATCVAATAIGLGFPVLVAPMAHAEEATPDLVVSTLPTAAPKPGEMYDQSVTVTNKGTAAADGVAFRIRLTRGLDFPAHVDGCTYSTVGDRIRQALCELDTVVQPGASLTVPVRFKALPQALMESVEYGTSPTGDAPGEGFDDSYRRLTLTADSTADLLAQGDLTEGAPGSEVTVTATLRNDGPGWIQNQESDDQPALMVRIPQSTAAVQVPKDCEPFGIDGPTGPSEPGHSAYVCAPGDHTIEVGQSLDYTFVLRIGSTAQDTRGEVTASSVYGIHPAFDTNLADDTAYLNVDVTRDGDPGTSSGGTTDGGSSEGGAGTGGQGDDPHGRSTGGSGTTGTNGATGTTGTAGTSGTSGTTSTPGASGVSGSTSEASGAGGSAGTRGSLAATGGNGMPILAAGAVAATAVGGLVLAAVRRRTAVR